MTRTRALALTAVGMLAGPLLLVGCSSSDSGGDAASSEAIEMSDGGETGDMGGTDEVSAQRDAALDTTAALSAADEDSGSAGGGSTGSRGEEASYTVTGREAEVIRTGTVSLRAEDVADARFEVQKVVDRYAGQVTDSETRTDRDGDVRDARLVVRVPSAEFTEAMDALEKVADLEASSSTSEDVTSQVVDTEVRIRVQRQSIARIEQLLDRAGSIRAVVNVERELSRREADLNALLQQQAYLSDRTSMSTITVHVQQPREGEEPEDDEETSGFLAGLGSGWSALTSAAVVLATVAGALLPFAAVALAVGVPGWALLRSMRRRRVVAPPAEPA